MRTNARPTHEPTTRFSAVLPTSLVEALDAKARREDRSRNYVLRKAVESYVTDDLSDEELDLLRGMPHMADILDNLGHPPEKTGVATRALVKVRRQLEAVSTEGQGS